ncbi:MAG: hypothetical protein L0220_33055 [Acidobacteria bacterium]|nr:hypothetical protein [Acidobacteriota bacterium]
MDSQEIKLGRPSITRPGELRIGRKVVTAEPMQSAPRSPVVTRDTERKSTVREDKPQELQVNKQVNKRGYSIGVNARPEIEQIAGGQGKNQPSVRPATLIMLCGAVIFLVVVLLSGSAKQARVRTGRSDFLNSYATYLVKNKESLSFDLNQRLADVEYRLQRVVVAEETGDYQKARADLYELMLLDRDANSPLYKQCSGWLQRLAK